MRQSVLVLFLMLGGCAGYAADYWEPKRDLIAEQLPRYGLSGEEGRCVEAALTKSLSVWQMRQLSDLAARLVPASGAAAVLGPRDLVYVAGLVKDPKVGPEVTRAIEGCSVRVAAPIPPAPVETPAAPASDAPKPLRWVPLGAASTGQAIAVDISTVVVSGTRRQAWFRMTDPGQTAPSPVTYHLRVDCPGKTITPLGARRYDDAGKLVENQDYGAAWQAALPVEADTVMEIAHRELCR